MLMEKCAQLTKREILPACVPKATERRVRAAKVTTIVSLVFERGKFVCAIRPERIGYQ